MSTRLLDQHPDVLLFATLTEAAIFLKMSQADISLYEQKFMGAMAELSLEDARNKVAGSTNQVSSAYSDDSTSLYSRSYEGLGV